jgi:16S rRNA (uracil1498-N3)-methyltransferase
VSALRTRADAAAQVFLDDLDALVLTDTDAHHLGRVLRLRRGEHVVAADGRGSWRLCAFTGEHALEPGGVIEHESAPRPELRVRLPAVKGERSEWAVAKLTELGVDAIGLLTCERAAIRLNAEAIDRVLGRWRRVAREASSQSRRVYLPEILAPTDVVDAVGHGAIRCDLDGDPLGDDVTELLVGPEGGWGANERHGTGVSLGETVLRTETAAVTAGVLLVTARRAARHDAGHKAQ